MAWRSDSSREVGSWLTGLYGVKSPLSYGMSELHGGITPLSAVSGAGEATPFEILYFGAQ